MNSSNRIVLSLGVVVLCSPNTILSEEHPSAGLSAAGLSVEMSVQSGFIDRGQDVFSDYARQKHRAYKTHSGAARFVPLIHFDTPTKGLSFELEGTFAIVGRPDQDIDGYMQTAPGEPNLLTSVTSLESFFSAYQSALLPNGGNQADRDALLAKNGKLIYPGCRDSSNGCAPAFYKEEVGLMRQDRLILTAFYERETKAGILGFGFSSDQYVNSKAHQQPSSPTNPTSEIIFKYALPFLPQIIYELSADMVNTYQYHNLRYEEAFSVTDDFSITTSLGVGYGVTSHLQGAQDVTAVLRFTYMGFFIEGTAALRPDFRFWDTDDADVGSENAPIWLTGRSSRGDGYVADPSRQYGYWNETINTLITQYVQSYFQSQNYPFTYQWSPRQRLPRVIASFSIGYGFAINP